MDDKIHLKKNGMTYAHVLIMKCLLTQFQYPVIVDMADEPMPTEEV